MACALIGAAASCAAFSAAQAQQGRSEAVANEPEIIVTSGKREQNLRDFPSSVAVITSEDIAETGKDSFSDFINTVPGLSVATNGPGYSTLAIRGITTGRVRQDEPQNKETVGLYLGDVPISANGFDLIGVRPGNNLPVLHDLEIDGMCAAMEGKARCCQICTLRRAE